MALTLDQARALDALARHGTFARAAAALNKRHTAVLYAVRTLEEGGHATVEGEPRRPRPARPERARERAGLDAG